MITDYDYLVLWHAKLDRNFISNIDYFVGFIWRDLSHNEIN